MTPGNYRVGFTRHPENFRGAGFTLIELLVVITIVIITMSVSVVFLQRFFRSNAIKYSAQIVQGVFRKTAQFAVTERQMYFILFDKDKSFMSVCEDSDGNNEFDKDEDKKVGETVALGKGVSFSDKAPLFKLDEPYIGFGPNGSLSLPVGVSDLSLKSPEEENADIILEQTGKLGRIYLDFTVTTGRIVKTIYREE